MSIDSVLAQALQLSPDERLHLVDEIWESLADDPQDVPVTEEQKAILRARLEAYRKNPEYSFTWDEVKARALARIRR